MAIADVLTTCTSCTGFQRHPRCRMRRGQELGYLSLHALRHWYLVSADRLPLLRLSAFLGAAGLLDRLVMMSMSW
jgi:hypothetical protein